MLLQSVSMFLAPQTQKGVGFAKISDTVQGHLNAERDLQLPSFQGSNGLRQWVPFSVQPRF